jgi:F-type H+-transporting ATPase subunit b
MPQLDVTTYPAQLFWLFLSFLCFFCVARWVLVPQLSATLKNREERLSKVLAEARALHEEAQQEMQIVETALQTAKQEARKKLTEELACLKAQCATQEEDLQKTYAAKRAEAVRALEEAVESACAQVCQEAMALSPLVLEKFSVDSKKSIPRSHREKASSC